MKNLIFTIVCLLLFQNAEAQTWGKTSAGMEFSMGLQSDGTLWAWGFNGNGQLGVGSLNQQEVLPLQVPGGAEWQDVSAGAFHCLGLKKDGTLWAWGINGNGQLGIGNLDQKNVPVQVGVDNDWVFIESGQAHNFAIKDDGTLWGWGFNSLGQVGDNSTTDKNVLVQIGTDNDWMMVKAGGAHTLALKTDQTLWAWGFNLSGQLGTGSMDDSLVPVQVGSANDWMNIDAGYEFSLAVKDDGTLWSWGFNGTGQLGDGSTTQVLSPTQPLAVDTIEFVSVTAGSVNGFAINENNELFAWGANLYGELGLGNTGQENNVTKVGSDNDWQFIAAAEGGGVGNQVFGFHTLGLRGSEDDICVTGANYVGMLGNGSTDNETNFSCNVGGGLTDVEQPIAVADKIQVYPNPSHGSFFIEKESVEDLIVNFYNLDGKLILQKGLIDTKTEIRHELLKTKGMVIYQIFDNHGTMNQSGKLFLN